MADPYDCHVVSGALKATYGLGPRQRGLNLSDFRYVQGACNPRGSKENEVAQHQDLLRPGQLYI
jgi:hypothetical protein